MNEPTQPAPPQPEPQQSAAPRFRKKPVIIEAFQITTEAASDYFFKKKLLPFHVHLRGSYHKDGRVHSASTTIVTLEGEMRAEIGDWIIKGVKGELYPCKPDIFEATYEPVSAPTPPQPEPQQSAVDLLWECDVEVVGICKFPCVRNKKGTGVILTGQPGTEVQQLAALHNEAVKELARRCDEAQAELERERMRLCACGVVALCDTPESAKEARKMHPDYESASCDDVKRRVDECIELRAQLAAAQAEAGRLRETLERLLAPQTDECRLDHHGYCQSHYLEPANRCCVAIARAALAKKEGQP